MCPKYTCEKGTDTSCANLKTGLTTDGFNKVQLTAICKSGEEHCDVPFPAWKSLADVDKDTAYTCKVNTKPDIKIRRFPGEKCEKSDDCIKTEDGTGTCDEKAKTCTGIAEGKECKSTAGCVVGFYCDAESHKCAAQKAKDGKCKLSEECVNELLCSAGTCSLAPFSLDVGKELEADDQIFNDFKCKFNYTHKGKCASLNQDAAGDKDGFVECNYGDVCKYKAGDDEVTGACDCGYNADGKGYCERGHNKREKQLTDAYTKIGKAFKNGCHSLSRNTCYLVTEKTVAGFAADINNLTYEHIFHNSVKCASDVLGGNFVSFSMMAVALFALLF
jgi:hypothetical protein